jgi:hypothetical protein
MAVQEIGGCPVTMFTSEFIAKVVAEGVSSLINRVARSPDPTRR